ncbi:uncharacterized protein PHACADRAFT_170742 [Phanerochaete carnosa HHB-10118-sp]|uniref:MYND-type domain-containing protein n=1 Tax=Phanerochaete carnosa (strain HHB-10118-sp) TaxID=650164 RepID=K5V4F3_PHACS|nr:uncharacterized protein PHACADRAFT_170742 [Phanerochaete carnosa HHB-10118-sp]EKM57486.1 hypothetical protein PHACADRAFT_170742 [Phanerochaete carnosa HHB-10118-sp]
MAHTVYWPAKTFFYPVGNTSPISLLQHVPPEDDADILLLGCGDPRSILYTIHASGVDQTPTKRKLDFTCCDIEPAIVARNILLFTFIADGEYAKRLDAIWNIFYHFFLNDASLALLHSQTDKLANVSVDLETWEQSGYSRFLEISNSFTLGELHRHWLLYSQTKSFSSARRAQFSEQFSFGMEKIRTDKKNFSDMTASRSAGPAALIAMSSSIEASHSFWQTGTTFTSQSDIGTATEVNPTFAYAMGGEGFMAHYGTNPLAAFHLAPIFATANVRGQTPLSQVYDGIRGQFRAWCEAFYVCVQDPTDKIKIRVVVADALAFCQALQLTAARSDPSVYPRVCPWRAPLLTLDGKSYSTGAAPLTFDVIDTSNLFDHIGNVNALVVTVPLLKRTPSAALYTESLLTSGEDPIVSFADSLCGDVTTMSLLFDVTPVAYLSGYNTQSNIHELLGFHVRDNSAQYHERLIWKVPSQLLGGNSRPVALDASQFASLLFDIYRRMFAHENVADFFRRKLSIASVQSLERIHYCRRSLAQLVHCLMGRISVDWNQVLDLFEQHLASDSTLLMGMNYYQDLITQLHLLQIWSADTLLPGNPRIVMNKNSGPFREWVSVPPVICVAFAVPRAKLQPLEEEDAPGNPMLAVEFGSNVVSNYFCSIETAFGSLSIDGGGEYAQAVITEDPRGKAGDADIIVSVCVPAWMLAHDPAATMVRLVIVSTPSTTVLVQKLGLRLVIYEARLMDAKAVSVLRSRPTVVDGTNAAVPHLSWAECAATSAPVSLTADGAKVDKMTRRTDIKEPKAKTALASKDTPVTITQAGACEVELSIGSAHHEKLGFPFPVDATQAKLRIARQSSWIEIVATPCLLGRKGAPIGTRFPVAIHERKPFPWTIHRVNLDRLPSLSTADVPKDRLKWINTHVSLAFSDAEKLSRETGAMQALTHVKDSMHSIFVQAVGIQGPKKTSVFGLHRTSGGGVDTLLFITDIRLDIAAHTILADAYALPLHLSFLHKLGPRLAGIRDLCQVNVSAEECIAWKYLLPSLAERCRTWEHTPKCAYAAPRGRVPLSTEHGEVPICACGQGKVGDAFRVRKEWTPFLPYVTRIALSPLFAVSFLESVAGGLKALVNSGKTAGTATVASRARETAPSSTSSGSRQPDVSRCGACKITITADRPMVCSRCKKAAYCSSDCQTSNWKVHKRSCKAV